MSESAGPLRVSTHLCSAAGAVLFLLLGFVIGNSFENRASLGLSVIVTGKPVAAGAPALTAAAPASSATPAAAVTETTFASWVNCGMAAASTNFDAAILPAFLNETAPHPYCKTPSRNVSILILGDSINRYMIDDGCGLIGGTLADWGVGFTYKVGASAAKACITPTGVIAYLNTYGSKPKGPYYTNHVNSPEDPWADTELRIAHGVAQFTERFGAPLLILFRGELWDLHVWLGSDISKYTTEDRNALFATYTNDNRGSIEAIRAAAPHALLGLHSVPLIKWANFLQRLHVQYVQAMRNFANDNALIYFDFFALTLQLRVQFDGDPKSEILLRDHHHPTAAHCAAFLRIIYLSAQRWSQRCRL
jgi:hypothetical protein